MPCEAYLLQKPDLDPMYRDEDEQCHQHGLLATVTFLRVRVRWYKVIAGDLASKQIGLLLGDETGGKGVGSFRVVDFSNGVETAQGGSGANIGQIWLWFHWELSPAFKARRTRANQSYRAGEKFGRSVAHNWSPAKSMRGYEDLRSSLLASGRA